MRRMVDLSSRTTGAAEWHQRLFSRSLAKQAKLRTIAALVGAVRGQNCLDLGGDNGVISYQLRRLGGTWTSADISEKAVASTRSVVQDRVELIQGSQLPFPDRTFDVVVIADLLEHVQDDAKLIEECHRVLKQSGRLIVNVPHRKRWSVLRPIRQLLGLTDAVHGHVRPGYTQSDLFALLKDGFNVEEVRTYSRFFSETVDTCIRFFVAQFSARKPQDPKGEMVDARDFERLNKLFRLYTLVYPLFWLAAKLDLLLFFTQGYSLAARAKWRPWIPRKTPVLRDGRSIAEAALTGKIGTAAPF